jgi:signal peptidase I
LIFKFSDIFLNAEQIFLLMRVKYYCKKFWNFFWKEDSIWSWLANIVIAFLLIRYLVYPILGVILGTGFPIVAVVSESMEHGVHGGLCGQPALNFHESFDNYWEICGGWYEKRGISREDFKDYPLRNGFDKGDVIILWRANPENLDVGDVLVFQGNKPQPIIHRIVSIRRENGNFFYQTKGDHNSDSFEPISETNITENRILGKGILRIPYLGWLKILFVDAVRPLGIIIER